VGIEVARWLISLGSVAAAVGFVLIGMATSSVLPNDGLFTLGLVLLIGGLVVLVGGAIAYKAVDEPDRSTH
jgi:hypothetical protein